MKEQIFAIVIGSVFGLWIESIVNRFVRAYVLANGLGHTSLIRFSVFGATSGAYLFTQWFCS